VHKHVYVHVAPDENSGGGLDNLPRPAPAQKHYKIIFVKTPSYDSQLAAQRAALATPKTEEKTLVYVLSRKPDDLPAPGTPGGPSTSFTPSKPEVYFIKYKAQTGAAADTGSVGGGNVGGGNTGGGVSVPTAQYGPAL
jgi:Domain of unknown function (DUF243)